MVASQIMKTEEQFESEDMSFRLVRSTNDADFHFQLWGGIRGDFAENGFIVGIGATREAAINNAADVLESSAKTVRLKA